MKLGAGMTRPRLKYVESEVDSDEIPESCLRVRELRNRQVECDLNMDHYWIQSKRRPTLQLYCDWWMVERSE